MKPYIFIFIFLSSARIQSMGPDLQMPVEIIDLTKDDERNNLPGSAEKPSNPAPPLTGSTAPEAHKAFLVAEKSLSAKEFNKARSYYEMAIKLDNHPSQIVTAVAALRLAALLCLEGEFEDARDWIDTVEHYSLALINEYIQAESAGTRTRTLVQILIRKLRHSLETNKEIIIVD